MFMLKISAAFVAALMLAGCSGGHGISENDAVKAVAYEEEWPEDMYYYHYSASTGKETIKGNMPEGELTKARKAKEQTRGLVNITLRSDSYIAKYGEKTDSVEQFVLDYRDSATYEIEPDSLAKMMKDFAESHGGRL